MFFQMREKRKNSGIVWDFLSDILRLVQVCFEKEHVTNGIRTKMMF